MTSTPLLSDDEVDESAPPAIAPGDPAWLTFEKDVKDFLASKDPNAKVTHNVKRSGKSGRLRQIDTLVIGELCGEAVEFGVEAKRYSKKVGIGVVDAFIGKCLDTGVQKGILYSHLGFDAGAHARAEIADHPKIHLRMLPESTTSAPTTAELEELLAELEPWDVVLPQFLGVHACPGEECYGEFYATQDWDGGVCDQCGFPVGMCQECERATRLDDDEQNCENCDSGAFVVEREKDSGQVMDIHWMLGLPDH